MIDDRRKNCIWQLAPNAIDNSLSIDQAQLAVLMDIRDELHAISKSMFF